MNLKGYWLLLPIILALGLYSCNTNPIVVEKYSEVLSEGIYASGDALIAGRPDLAEQYIADIEKIIPIPLTRLVITPVIYQGVHYVILNDRETGATVVIVGSTEFNVLLKAKAISAVQQQTVADFQAKAAQQAKNDQAALQVVVIENNQLKAQIADDAAQITAYHKTIEYKVKMFFKWLAAFSILGISGWVISLVVCLIFFPPLVPLIMETGGSIVGIIWRACGYILQGIVSFLTSIFSKS